MSKRPPTTNEFINAERAESLRVLAFLDGKDVSGGPLWHSPGVPTWYNAVINLAPAYGIVQDGKPRIQRTAQQNGMPLYLVTVPCRRGNRREIGAACSVRRQVAVQLALRNAIRKLCPQEGQHFLYFGKFKDDIADEKPDGHEKEAMRP